MKGSDNTFPKVIFAEQDPVTPADVSTPAANKWALFVGDDGALYLMDDGGTITAAGGGGSGTLADGDYGDVTVSSSGTVITVDAATITEAKQVLADNTTNDVSSTKHGYAPKSPADATKFLNGAATPAFALVKDSDLSTSDITTNDVSTSKHGFAPKGDGSTTKFLNANGAYSTPASSGALTLVEAKTFTAAATTFTFAATLDGNTDGTYLLIGKIKNNKGSSGTVNYTLQPNAGSSNQVSQQSFWNGSSLVGGNLSSLYIGFNVDNNNVMTFNCTIHARITSHSVTFPITHEVTGGAVVSGGTRYTFSASGQDTTGANITSLKIVADQSNGIGDGSELYLYKYAQS